MKYIAQSGIEEFLEENGENNANQLAQYFVDTLRMRIDTVKAADAEFKEYVKEEKKRKRRTVKADSDLTDFLIDQMVKFYLLVSIRPDAIDFRLLKHANYLEKFHIVINTTDKDLEEDLVHYCTDKGLEFTVTESDGTPATGKNSMLDVFLKSDNEYAVCKIGRAHV